MHFILTARPRRPARRARLLLPSLLPGLQACEPLEGGWEVYVGGWPGGCRDSSSLGRTQRAFSAALKLLEPAALQPTEVLILSSQGPTVCPPLLLTIRWEEKPPNPQNTNMQPDRTGWGGVRTMLGGGTQACLPSFLHARLREASALHTSAGSLCTTGPRTGLSPRSDCAPRGHVAVSGNIRGPHDWGSPGMDGWGPGMLPHPHSARKVPTEKDQPRMSATQGRGRGAQRERTPSRLHRNVHTAWTAHSGHQGENVRGRGKCLDVSPAAGLGSLPLPPASSRGSSGDTKRC